MQTSKIQLKSTSILNIPLQTYEKDFTFIVNGKEFKTSRLIAELLSPKICQMHTTDITINQFTINTKSTGNFNHVLQLVNFNQQEIPKIELIYALEVLQNLGTECVDFDLPVQLTKDNIFEQINMHEKENDLYHSIYKKEIEFISSNFIELCETNKNELKNLQISTLCDILDDESLVLKDEDQLLQFINELYTQDHKYSILYETVHFSNVSKEEIGKFIELYDFNDMTNLTWSQICERLKEDIQKNPIDQNRYNKDKKSSKVSQNVTKVNGKQFTFATSNQGIINYLTQQSNGNIENEISVTSTSVNGDISYAKPINVVLGNDDSFKYFSSEDMQNSSLTLNFKNYRIIPTGYTLNVQGIYQRRIPRSWVIEGSTDYNNWEVIDSRNDFSNFDSLLTMNNDNSHQFQFIRMRLTGPNWSGSNHFYLRSIEIYGTLI